MADFFNSLLRSSIGRWLTVVAAAALFYAFHTNVFGAFETPSFLPGAGILFLIGIGSRLGFAYVPRLADPGPAFLLAMAIAYFSPIATAPVAWAGFLLAMNRDVPIGASARVTDRILSVLFESLVAQAIGNRSYTVYLFHYVALLAVLAVSVRGDGLVLFSQLVLVGIPLTVVGAEVLHRLVEQPGIALGRRLAMALRGGRSLRPA